MLPKSRYWAARVLHSTLTSGATTISHRFQAGTPECNTGLCCVGTIVGVRLKRHMSMAQSNFSDFRRRNLDITLPPLPGDSALGIGSRGSSEPLHCPVQVKEQSHQRQASRLFLTPWRQAGTAAPLPCDPERGSFVKQPSNLSAGHWRPGFHMLSR